jgi:hypothetical protein
MLQIPNMQRAYWMEVAECKITNPALEATGAKGNQQTSGFIAQHMT